MPYLSIKRILKTPHTIRTWLTLLVIACISPAAVASIFFVYRFYFQERTNILRTTVDTARILMQAVDRELSSGQGTLQALATSPYLVRGDLMAFHRQAEEALRYRAGNNVVLSDISGQQLVNTMRAFGDPLPRHGNMAQLNHVIQTSRPAISDLYIGGVTGRPLISIDVPVVKEGKVIYVLSMGFFPERLGEILTQVRFSKKWIVSIFDSTGTVVARTLDPEKFVGRKGAAALVREIANMPEGSVETDTLEGVPVTAVFSRSTISRWSVAIGVVKAEFLTALTASIFLIIATATLLLIAGLLLARTISSRIALPIAGLVGPAMALGRGGPVVVPDLVLKEANDVGQALMKAFQLLQDRTKERNKAESHARQIQVIKQQLEESELFLSGIFEEAPDAIFVVAASGMIERANVAAEKMFGYSRDHLHTLMVESLMSNGITERHRHMRSAFFSKPMRRQMGTGLDLWGKRCDGTMFPIDVMLSPLRIECEDWVIATVRDITERQRNEEALRASEARFRNILENAPIGMAIVSLEGRWIEVNNAVCEIVGYDKKSLQDMDFQGITHPDDLDADLAFVKQLLNGEIRSYQMEKRYVRKDGGIVFVLLTGSLLRDNKGSPLHFIAQIQDITERKETEAELNALHHRLSMATEAGGIAVWEWDLVSNSLLWDDRMYALYRVSKDVINAQYDLWKRHVYPEDIERVERELKSALSDANNFSCEFRIIWPSGEIRTIRADAIISRNSANVPIRMTGINWDVTEQMQKEQTIKAALREKETLLKELYHRVKNNLQVINSLLNLQSRTMAEGPARTALKEGADRVRAMALVHEKFYQSGNLALISLDEYIVDLCKQLGNAVAADQRHIAVVTELESIQVGLEIAIPLGLLLNEVISNSLKHAFPDNRHGTITVHIAKKANAMAELMVVDDGIGMPKDIDLSAYHSMGLKLVMALSRQLSGKLSMESENGTCVHFIFPLVAQLARNQEAA